MTSRYRSSSHSRSNPTSNPNWAGAKSSLGPQQVFAQPPSPLDLATSYSPQSQMYSPFSPSPYESSFAPMYPNRQLPPPIPSVYATSPSQGSFDLASYSTSNGYSSGGQSYRGPLGSSIAQNSSASRSMSSARDAAIPSSFAGVTSVRGAKYTVPSSPTPLSAGSQQPYFARSSSPARRPSNSFVSSTCRSPSVSRQPLDIYPSSSSNAYWGDSRPQHGSYSRPNIPQASPYRNHHPDGSGSYSSQYLFDQEDTNRPSGIRRGHSQVDPDSPVQSRIASPTSFEQPSPTTNQFSRSSLVDARAVRRRAQSPSPQSTWRATSSIPSSTGSSPSPLPSPIRETFTPAAASFRRRETGFNSWTQVANREIVKRTCFTPEELNCLNTAWIQGHYYPSPKVVGDIMTETQLTKVQVRGWYVFTIFPSSSLTRTLIHLRVHFRFANKRQRASEQEKEKISECAKRLASSGALY